VGDDSDLTLGGNLTGLAVALAIPFGWEMLGIPHPLVGVFLGAIVGAVCLARLDAAHRDTLDRGPGAEDTEGWLQRQLRRAQIGVAVVIGGSVLLRLASSANSRLLAAVAVLAVFVGLIPVLRVVRFDASRAEDVRLQTDGSQWAAALRLNVVLAAAAVVPVCVVLGGLSPGWIVAAVGLAFWLLGAYAWRFEQVAVVLTAAGAVLILAAAVVFWLLDITTATGLMLPGGLTGIGLILMIASGRGLSDRLPAAAHLLVALGFLVGGAYGVNRVIGGDTVSHVLVFVAVAAPVAFGITLVTKGEGLLIAVGVALFVVWAMADHTGPPQPLADNGADLVIGAFGDSYMAGEGVGTFYQDANTAWERGFTPGGVNGCRRSPTAYPELVRTAIAAEWDGQVSLDFRACSGAKSVSTDGWEGGVAPTEGDHNSVIGQLLRFDAAGHEGAPSADELDLVLLSLGGNDGGFSTIGTACFMPHSCGSAVNAIREQDLATVSLRVQVALEEADRRFPGTPVLVVAYPQMFGDDTTDCGLPFSGDEIEELRTFVFGLNRAVAAAITNLGASGENITHVTGAQAAFIGERFCEEEGQGERSAATAMNVLALEPTEGKTVFDRLTPTVIVHNTFHPTARGHELLADAVLPVARAALGLSGDASISCDDESEACVRTTVPPGTGARAQSPCRDIDHYVACVTVGLIRQLFLPITLLVLSGRSLGVIGRQRAWFTRFVGWGRASAPSGALRSLFDLLPLRDRPRV